MNSEAWSAWSAFPEPEQAVKLDPARLSGVQPNETPPSLLRPLTTAQVSDLRARVAAGEPKASLARELGISRQTLYQYLRPPEPARPARPG